MAYRFDGSDDDVRFTMGTFDGYTAGDLSAAMLLKRNATGAWHGMLTINDAAGAASGTVLADVMEFSNGNVLAFWNGQVGGEMINGSTATTITDTTNWMIVGLSFDGGGTTPRFHWKIGSGSWNHENITGTLGSADMATMATADRIIVGTDPSGGDDLSADVACVGMIEAFWADADFEALSLTSFAAWETKFTGSGAWLIGFEDSGTQTDRTGNGGNEDTRSGTTLVSDPPSWVWDAGTTYEKDEIAIVTMTGGGTRILDHLKSGTAIMGP